MTEENIIVYDTSTLPPEMNEVANLHIRRNMQKVADPEPIGPPKITGIHPLIEWAARSIVWGRLGVPVPASHATAIARVLPPHRSPRNSEPTYEEIPGIWSEIFESDRRESM